MRTRSETDPPLSTLIDTAVDRGIIDVGQGDRLRMLALELAPSDAATGQAHALGARAPRVIEPPREARGGFNAITVAYSLGAMLVLFALGWFLVDRWRSLGPIGVFAVSALYAIAFAACAV